jgi:hypothetical protein
MANRPGGAVDLVAMLIKPVQRICQYPLLFRAVVAEVAITQGCEAELAGAQEALIALASSTANVNELVRQGELQTAPSQNPPASTSTTSTSGAPKKAFFRPSRRRF